MAGYYGWMVKAQNLSAIKDTYIPLEEIYNACGTEAVKLEWRVSTSLDLFARGPTQATAKSKSILNMSLGCQVWFLETDQKDQSE